MFDRPAKRPDNPGVVLLEIATQGIRGAVSASGRATFRPGYVVVPVAGDAFCATLGALLWCDTSAGDVLRAAAGHAIRAGATFTTPDRTLYRLVTDFASEFQLQRYEGAARSFSPVAAGRAAVTDWMRGQLGVESRGAMEDLLWVCSAALPSRVEQRARAIAAPVPAPAQEPQLLRARIAELRDEVRRSQAVDELQRRVDELQSRLFRIEDALREGARLTAELDRVDAQLLSLAPFAAAADQLGDVEARFAAHDRATARRDEAFARISEERETLAKDAAAPPPLWKLPQLWGGIAAGLVALSAGIASRGALRYVALLDVPAFGWSAWTALRWVGRLEAEQRAARRTRVVDEREKKVREQWESDAGPLRRALAAAGVTELEELRKALDSVTGARAARQAAAEAVASWRERTETQDAETERTRVEAELKDADAALSALATGYVRDVGTLEAEIARLEAELAEEQPPPPAEARERSGDVLADLVRRAAAEIGPADEDALARIESRASELLAVIGGRRVEALWTDPDGAVVVQPAGGRVRFADLAPDVRDLCWTALKLAFVEHALARGGAFAVVDGALDALPLAARRVAAHVLKRAARSGQVLHATADPVFREAADHAA